MNGDNYLELVAWCGEKMESGQWHDFHGEMMKPLMGWAGCKSSVLEWSVAKEISVMLNLGYPP